MMLIALEIERIDKKIDTVYNKPEFLNFFAFKLPITLKITYFVCYLQGPAIDHHMQFLSSVYKIPITFHLESGLSGNLILLSKADVFSRYLM